MPDVNRAERRILRCDGPKAVLESLFQALRCATMNSRRNGNRVWPAEFLG
jgi:hypothetical protein